MTKTRYAVALSVALCAALTACGDDDHDSDEHQQAATTAATTSPAVPAPAQVSASASQQSAAEKVAGLPPAPQQDSAEAYVSMLRQIDADIVAGASSEALVDRGRAQCITIYNVGGDDDQADSAANARFATVKHPKGFGDKADEINDAVKKYICPKNWN